MSLIEDLIKALTQNSNTMSSMQRRHFEDLFIRMSSGFVASKKLEKEEAQKREKAQQISEELTSSTMAFGLAGIESSESMNEMEAEYSNKCVEISNQLKDKNLTDGQRQALLIQLRETHDKLEQIRTLYDRPESVKLSFKI